MLVNPVHLKALRFMLATVLWGCALTGTTAFAVQTAAADSRPAGPATKAGASAATMNQADQAMLKSMAQAQLNQIAAARQALDMSKNDNVRKFAQTMLDEHGKALASISALAQAKHVSLPAEADAAHQKLAARLQKMQGDRFDKAYIQQAGLNDHSKVHSMLQKNAGKARDADLEALVAAMAPTVAAHLDAAKNLQVSVAGTAGAAGAAR